MQERGRERGCERVGKRRDASIADDCVSGDCEPPGSMARREEFGWAPCQQGPPRNPRRGGIFTVSRGRFTVLSASERQTAASSPAQSLPSPRSSRWHAGPRRARLCSLDRDFYSGIRHRRTKPRPGVARSRGTSFHCRSTPRQEEPRGPRARLSTRAATPDQTLR